MKQGEKENINDLNKDNLLSFDLKSFLSTYTEKDVLKLKRLFPEGYILLSEQLKLYPKAAEKLPTFAKNYCYFTTKSYEQSSSERLAEYKAGLYSGEMMIDLTGGLGVDDRAFSKSFKKVISVDIDEKLNELVRINFQKLGIKNIERITADSNQFIQQKIHADLVYIDADRRTGNKRSVTLEDAEPPVLEILPGLFRISTNVLLKLSPLIDITYLIKALPYVEKIIVISLDNEVKEVLTLLNKDFHGEIIIEAVDISKNDERKYSAKYGLKAEPGITPTGKYFYESAASVIKAGLVNNYTAENELNVIYKNGVYLLTDSIHNNFFGRGFEVVEQFSFSKSAVKKYLEHNKITKANVAKRNFPLSADEIKKLFKITDGGEEYLFFTQSQSKEKLFFHCRKL